MNVSPVIREYSKPGCFSWHSQTPGGSTREDHLLECPLMVFAPSDRENASLSFLALDSADSSASDLSPLMTVPLSVQSPFRVLEWTTCRSHSGSIPLIAGAQENGRLTFYDPSKILTLYSENRLRGGDSTVPLRQHHQTTRPDFGIVHQLQTPESNKHVTCMRANQQIGSENKLAVGYESNGVEVYDLSTLNLLHKVGDSKSNLSGACTGMDWNPSAAAILASSYAAGPTSVWDTRTGKRALEVTDPAKRLRTSVVRFIPHHPTSLVVSYDDDQNASVQLWDLRSSNYPYRELTGQHSRGITGIDFCPSDPSLFTTSSRDGRAITWLASDKPSVFGEVNVGESVSFVSHCPTHPTLLAVKTANQHLSVYNWLRNLSPSSSNGSRYVPKWMKPAVSGCDFGFGGRLGSFIRKSPTETSLSLSTVYTDADIVSEAEKFQFCLDNSDFSGYCEFMGHQSAMTDPESALEWELIGCHFRPPAERAERIRQLFGYDRIGIERSIETYLGHKGGSQFVIQPEDNSSGVFEAPQCSGVTSSTVDPEAFFHKLVDDSAIAGGMAPGEGPGQQSVLGRTAADAAAVENVADILRMGNIAVGGKADWSAEPLSAFKNAFIIGDKLAAVELALRANRFIEALVLASSVPDTSVWRSVLDAYLEKANDPFLSGVVAASHSDYASMVRTADLSQWRSTVASLCTYVNSETDRSGRSESEFKTLVGTLGQQLESETGDVRSAVLCYTIAGNFSKALDIWSSMSTSTRSPRQRLQSLAHKGAVWHAATRFDGSDDLFSRTLSSYAELLANCGQLVVAMKLLQLIPSADARVAALKFRIYNAAEEQMRASGIAPPAAPHASVKLHPSPDLAVARQAQPNMMSSSGYGYNNNNNKIDSNNNNINNMNNINNINNINNQMSRFPPNNNINSNAPAGGYRPPMPPNPPQPHGPPNSTAHFGQPIMSPFGSGAPAANAVMPPPPTSSMAPPVPAGMHPQNSNRHFLSASSGGFPPEPVPSVSNQFYPNQPPPIPAPPPRIGGTSQAPPPPVIRPHQNVPAPNPDVGYYNKTGSQPAPAHPGYQPHAHTENMQPGFQPLPNSNNVRPPPVNNPAPYSNQPPPVSMAWKTQQPPAQQQPPSAPGPVSHPNMYRPPNGPQLGSSPPPQGSGSSNFANKTSGAYPPMDNVPTPPQLTPGSVENIAPQHTNIANKFQPSNFSAVSRSAPEQFLQPNAMKDPNTNTGVPNLPSPPTTAPALAAASILQQGMPVPWPIPTATQQVRSTTTTTEGINQKIHETTTPGHAGDPCPPARLRKLQNTIDTLLQRAQLADDPRDFQEMSTKVAELMTQLSDNQVVEPVQDLLEQISESVNLGDWVKSQSLMHDVVKLAWNKTNKTWVMPLRRLLVTGAAQ